MHIEIHLRNYSPDYLCKCSKKPKYLLMVKGHPKDMEPPFSLTCCEECVGDGIKIYEDLLLTYDNYKLKYQEEIDDLFKIRREAIERARNKG